MRPVPFSKYEFVSAVCHGAGWHRLGFGRRRDIEHRHRRTNAAVSIASSTVERATPAAAAMVS